MAKLKKMNLTGIRYFRPTKFTKPEKQEEPRINVQSPIVPPTQSTLGVTPVSGQVGQKMGTAQYFGSTPISGAGAKLKTTTPPPPPPPVKPTVPPLTTLTTKWGVSDIMDTVTQSIVSRGGLDATPTATSLQTVFAPLVGRMKASTQFAYSVLQSLGLPTGGWHPRYGYRNQAMMGRLYQILADYMRQYYPDITSPEPRIGGEPPPPGLGTTKVSMV